MKILIIGSQGFIGSNMVKHFLHNHDDITGCDLVETDSPGYSYFKISVLSPDFDTLFLNQDFDICINASGSGNVSYSLEHPISDFEANTILVSKILDTLRKHQPNCKYIQISSAAIYGNPESLPVSETSLSQPLSPYGYHKWMSEIICREYNRIYNIPVAILRPFSVYGRGLRKQLLWDICQKVRLHKSIELFGTGNETRDFIHIDDLVKAISLIIGKGSFNCDTYNIASGTETRIAEIAAIFQTHLNHDSVISFSGQVKKGDPSNWRADITKLKELGFKPTRRFQDGITDYISWFEKNINE
jgi:UDP-glucose 4-epimerase